MSDIMKTYQERFRRSRHNFRRYAALLLALSMITTLFVNWQLHGVGISMTADYQCGEEEHTHTADCYEKILICGYEEGEVLDPGTGTELTVEDPTDSGIALYSAEPEYIFVPHEHTEDCYTEVQTLTCWEEEHIHDDDCFDPEDGSLICDQFEHTHDDRCYTTDYELTCGLEEGELVEELNPDYVPAASFEVPVVVEPVAEPEVHHHTEDCYEEVLVCPFPEHHHTVNCLADQLADVEDEDEWLQKTDTTLDGFWSDDLIRVAQSQLGYEQSEKNFQLDTDDGATVRHYTRYGQWYGNPYGEWDVMFLSYCLHYAGIPQDAVPQRAGVLALRSDMRGMDWLLNDADGSAAAPGDIVIYSKNKMDTVVQEQPEIRDDTASSDSGIAVLPADSAAAKPVVIAPDFTVPTAPTPVFTTQSSFVDTVGIVTAVDEELGTLTVISGDVDGSVAEVQLSFAEVESVISVVSAQAALNGSFTTLEGIKYLDYFEETPEGSDKGGVYEYNVSINNIDYSDDVEVTVGQTVNLDFKYKIEAGTLTRDDPVLHYKLPAGLEPPETITKPIYDANNNVIGEQVFNTDGTSTLTFDPDKIDVTQTFFGKFAYDWTVRRTSTMTDDKVTFPGSSTSITLKKPQDIKAEKSVAAEEKDGVTVLHYTVTVSSQDGWEKEKVFIHDKLSINDASTLGDIKFTNFVLKKFAKDAADGKLVPVGTPSVTQNNNDFSFAIDDLDTLAAGEKYVLTYDVELPNKSGKGWHSFNNTASTNDNQNSNSTYTTTDNRVEKSGSYNAADDTITWTVKIYNPSGADLNGDTITDLLAGDSAVFDGEAKLYVVQENNGAWHADYSKLIDHFTPTTNPFTYTFDSTKTPGETSHKQYHLVYKTKVPAGQTSVRNDATYEHGDSTYTDGSSIGITDNAWNVKKTTTSDSGLILKDADQKLYEAAWAIDVDMPKSVTNNTITDIIDVGCNGSSNIGRFEHYAYAQDLQQQFENNLTITYEDAGTEKVLHYSDLAKNGIQLTIQYYTNRNLQTTIDASNNTKRVQAFTIEIDSSACKLKLKHLHLPYNTLAQEVRTLGEGETVTIKNTAGNSVSYTYRKPKSTVSVVKGSWNTSGLSTGREWGSYGSTNPNASFNYQTNARIGYQVVLDLSSLESLTDLTLTDLLPVGTEYDPDSTSVIFGNGPSSGSAKESVDTTDGKTFSFRSFAQAGDLEPTITKSVDPDNQGDTLVFNWKLADKKIDFAKLKAQGYSYLVLRYRVKVTDSRWSDPRTGSITYENKISYSDTVEATATTNINRPADVVKKQSEQIHATANESRVRYTVTLNPTGRDLNPHGNTLVLTDKLTVKSQNVHATLDLDSVQLYYYPMESNPTPLNPQTDYQFKAPTEDFTNGTRTYTMTVTIPDETPLVLVYEYVTDAKADVTLRNDAQLEGYGSHYTDQTYTAVGGSSQAYQSGLTIHKVDSRNDKIALAGAKFRLEAFDPTSGAWNDLQANGFVTDATGSITFHFADSTGDVMDLSACTLYRLTEVEAPDGYKKSDTVYYFIYRDATDTAVDDSTAYRTALGDSYVDDNGSADIPAKSSVTFYTNQSAHHLYVHNVANSLTIKKYWLDQAGYPVDGDAAPKTSVTVKLYQHPEGTTPNPAVDTLVDTIVLKQSDGWSYKYSGRNGSGLDDHVLYYIVEETTGNRFEVTYGPENATGVGAGGVLTVTNRETGFSDYELPSTGGAGTTPFTTVGGALMLTAVVVYGVHRKRRQEGRAES